MSGGMKQLLTDKKSVYECVSNEQTSYKTRLIKGWMACVALSILAMNVDRLACLLMLQF